MISIEAGFGRGKTFFRKAWAEHLRQIGEVVVEVDVQQSDHSGDPVVTLLGAMIDAVPEADKAAAKKALESAKKIVALGAKTVTRVLLRAGADEVIDAVTDGVADKLGDFEVLEGVVEQFGGEMSKLAATMITSQLATEKMRTQELPAQLQALHEALTANSDKKQVVVFVDELDRCHPEYAISFLEAMKLVFGQAGFVFCLMVNADYLERLAHHRFGVSTDDERYLDKFVDLRLQLKPGDEAIRLAVKELVEGLPLAIPFGEHPEFSIERAAELACERTIHFKLSMRMVKRVVLRLEVALRCYAEVPIDLPLLVHLAFNDAVSEPYKNNEFPRSKITQERWARIESEDASRSNQRRSLDRVNELNSLVYQEVPELSDLPQERYRLPEDKDYHVYAKVYRYLASHYIPTHRDVLDSVAKVVSD